MKSILTRLKKLEARRPKKWPYMAFVGRSEEAGMYTADCRISDGSRILSEHTSEEAALKAVEELIAQYPNTDEVCMVYINDFED